MSPGSSRARLGSALSQLALPHPSCSPVLASVPVDNQSPKCHPDARLSQRGHIAYTFLVGKLRLTQQQQHEGDFNSSPSLLCCLQWLGYISPALSLIQRGFFFPSGTSQTISHLILFLLQTRFQLRDWSVERMSVKCRANLAGILLPQTPPPWRGCAVAHSLCSLSAPLLTWD